MEKVHQLKKIKVMEGCWKKGGLHAHTLWSDGRSLPERAIGAVKKAGFDFWSVTEHNTFPDDRNAWREICREEGPWPPRLTDAEFHEAEHIVPGYPVTRRAGWCVWNVRLMTFREMCKAFNEPDRFVLIPGCELTTFRETGPDGRHYSVHANWLNIPEAAEADHECKTPETMLDAHYARYRETARKYARPTFFQLNHPFWPYFDTLSTMVIERPWITHAELCNGEPEQIAPACMPGIEKWWDAVNAFRIADGKPCLFGTAGDDTHFYDADRGPRRFCSLDSAFVMVHNPGKMTADSLIRALNRGDFYFSTGPCFDSIVMDQERGILMVGVRRIPGAKCRIRFNVTRRGFDRTVETRRIPFEGNPALDRDIPVYSDDIGLTAFEKNGWTAEYRMSPDDLYVRATAVTDIPCTRETGAGKIPYRSFPAFQTAFTQPMIRMR